ncbi:hypothetical protein DL98DRAFT_532981 [Cadophora sp. DSE1049]|nr:hypothetical protein DL98DRAFT_532981 [Cadophora sp. DSE1049]
MLSYKPFKGGSRRPKYSITMLPRNLLKRGSRREMHSPVMPILRKQTDNGLKNIAEEELYQYTRYRWLYNEPEQLANRYRRFDIPSLVNVSVNAVGCVELVKCFEGQYNKAMFLKMDNRAVVVAKLPHPNAGPAFYTTASEVATRKFLRGALSFPIPRVLAFSVDVDNPVGAEYIIEEKAEGEPLEKFWHQWGLESKLELVSQLVDLETKLSALTFQEHGCIYFKKDLEEKGILASAMLGDYSSKYTSAPIGFSFDEFAIGPLTEPKLWQGERALMKLHRGPWSDPLSYMRAIGENELKWMALHGKAQTKPYDILGHLENGEYPLLLQAYLRTLPKLATGPFPTSLSHPDLSPNNIFVDPHTKKITCITGWQSASVSEPFFQCKLPSMLVPTNRRYTEPQKDATESRNRRIATCLVAHYQKISSIKNAKHWSAVNIRNRSLLYDPVSLVTGALGRNDIFPLQRAMSDIIAQWDQITPAPQPHSVFLSKSERKFLIDQGKIHDLVVRCSQEYHDRGDILKGGMVRPGKFYTAALQQCRRDQRMFLEMADSEAMKNWFRRLWRHIFQREMK